VNTKFDVKNHVRDIPDFPKEGILFRDITPLLLDPKALACTLDLMESWAAAQHPDLIVGIESRGFIFGVPLAARMGLGFVPVRKPGKLPGSTLSEQYALEYGEDALEIHEDAIDDGQRVLLVDDLLATGGTAAAAGRLVSRAGGRVVGSLFVIELADLGGRRLLEDQEAHALAVY